MQPSYSLAEVAFQCPVIKTANLRLPDVFRGYGDVTSKRNGLIEAVPYPAILFWGGGGVGFSTSVARRKTIVQLGSLGGHCKLSSVGSRGKALENFGYFAF